MSDKLNTKKPQSYKVSNTSTLFYGQFARRISFTCHNIYLLHEVNKNNVEYKINNLKFYTNGFYTSYIDDTKKLIKLLKFLSKCKVDYLLKSRTHFRGEIYFNDELILKYIEKYFYIGSYTKPTSEKEEQYLLKSNNKIVRKQYKFKYKVYLKDLNNRDNFIKWANSMGTDSIQFPNSFIKYPHAYFYVCNLKILDLCKLHIGSSIKKIEETVTEDEIH